MAFNQLKVHPFQSCGFRCVNLHPYTEAMEGEADVHLLYTNFAKFEVGGDKWRAA